MEQTLQSYNLEKLRECCDKEKSFLIIYDGGNTSDLPILVCQSCYDTKPIFQSFIKYKKLLSKLDLSLKISGGLKN